MNITVVNDCTGENVSHLPTGQLAAGYDTGTDGVAWTESQFADHPGALHICQDANATVPTSDYLDVESGAATFADCPGWAKRAMDAFRNVDREGQRSPGIYASASNVTPVVNALIAGGVRTGIGLIVANWNLSEAQAVQDVLAASGPFPIVGIQFHNEGPYDINIMSAQWLNNMATHSRLSPPSPPGTWFTAVMVGIGPGGPSSLFQTEYDSATGAWSNPAKAPY